MKFLIGLVDHFFEDLTPNFQVVIIMGVISALLLGIALLFYPT